MKLAKSHVFNAGGVSVSFSVYVHAFGSSIFQSLLVHLC